MKEDLTKDFKKIKHDIIKSGKDYKTMVERGDLFIPYKLLTNKKLSMNDILYICRYYIYNKNIEKTDFYMLKTLNKVQLKRIKNKLCKLLYIEQIKLQEEIKKMTIKLSHKGKKCEWCGKESYILQEHHYPIQRKDGGKEIVNICPNCHYTYHSIMDNKQYR